MKISILRLYFDDQCHDYGLTVDMGISLYIIAESQYIELEHEC